MQIKKIFIFDDDDGPFNKVVFTQDFVVELEERLKNGVKSREFISEQLVIYIYCLNEQTEKIIVNNHQNDISEWDENNIEKTEEKTLIICDYSWESYRKKYNEEIWKWFKNNRDCIFVCSTRVMPDEAEEWIESISGQNKACEIKNRILEYNWKTANIIHNIERYIGNEFGNLS